MFSRADLQAAVETALLNQAKKRQRTTDTPARAGEKALDDVKKIGGFVELPNGDGPAMFSTDQQAAANGFESEKRFDVFMTSFFRAALEESGLVLVNSEVYRWLSQSDGVGSHDTDLKPDFFATHYGMYETRNEPNDGLSAYRLEIGGVFRFGVAPPALNDSLIIFESKLSFTEKSGFGEIVRYVECLPAGARAVLFDRKRCWLITSLHNRVVRIESFQWTQPGSSRFLSSFLTASVPEWVTRLKIACESLDVSCGDGDSFLGAGGTGRVFKVTDNTNGIKMALKIVGEDSVGSLLNEHDHMRSLADTDFVASVVRDPVYLYRGETLVGETLVGAAMLMSHVGQKVLRGDVTRGVAKAILAILFELHHSGFQHGDARLANVICVDGKYRWIDLVGRTKNANCSFKEDTLVLCRSLLGVEQRGAVPDAVDAAVTLYNNRRTLQSCTDIADVIPALSD